MEPNVAVEGSSESTEVPREDEHYVQHLLEGAGFMLP